MGSTNLPPSIFACGGIFDLLTYSKDTLVNSRLISSFIASLHFVDFVRGLEGFRTSTGYLIVHFVLQKFVLFPDQFLNMRYWLFMLLVIHT